MAASAEWLTCGLVYAARRQRLLERMGPGAVAFLQGARLVTRSADTEYPFRQDSDFHYLTGFDHPHAVAVLRSDGGPPYTLFVEPRDRAAETWTGYRPGVEGAVADHGADEAYPIDELHKRLPELVAGAERAFHALRGDPAIDAKLLETWENMRLRSRLGRVPPDAVVDPRAVVHEMRLRKEPGELDLMRRAAAISLEGHRAAARIAREGVFEYALEAALEIRPAGWAHHCAGNGSTESGGVMQSTAFSTRRTCSTTRTTNAIQ